MSGTAVSRDTLCRSLGFVNHPPRGYARSVKTCFRNTTTPETFTCRVIAKAHVGVSETPVFIAQFGFTSSLGDGGSGDTTMTLDANAITTKAYRFIQATIEHDGGMATDSQRIVAGFLDADQTQIRVVTKLHNNAFSDQNYYITVCECTPVTN